MRFREKLARFMYGRYGVDSLYNALFAGELILLFLAAIFSVLGKVEPILTVISVVIYMLSLGLIVFALYRVFSRNIIQRRRENEAWLRCKTQLFRKRRARMPADTADHIFRACPHCRATLRLPRQHGKHEVKCPRCGHRFGVKVK